METGIVFVGMHGEEVRCIPDQIRDSVLIENIRGLQQEEDDIHVEAICNRISRAVPEDFSVYLYAR